MTADDVERMSVTEINKNANMNITRGVLFFSIHLLGFRP